MLASKGEVAPAQTEGFEPEPNRTRQGIPDTVITIESRPEPKGSVLSVRSVPHTPLSPKYLPVLRSMRLIPVVAGANIDHHRHVQFANSFHSLPETVGNLFDFLARDFCNQFVVHLENESAVRVLCL